MRGYRLAVLAVAAWLLWAANRQSQQIEPGPAVSLADSQRIFPSATRLGPRDLQRNGHSVLAANGSVLGFILKTSPETDDLIGYAGPNNLLVGLAPDGTIVRVLLLSSGDTTAHVDVVKSAADFWKQFVGWRPAVATAPPVDAVSGSTLTSLAMAESVQRRLAGSSVSMRFPATVTLEEIQTFWPAVVAISPEDPRQGWTRAVDTHGTTAGYVVRTSPATDSLIGYSGPTESLMAVGPDQQTILAVRLRSSYDTPEYVERVRDDDGYLARFQGMTLSELRDIDFVAAGIEGVSGATQTSYAVAEGLRRRAVADEVAMRAIASGTTNTTPMRDYAMAAFVVGALWLTFSKRKGRRLRAVWQLLLIAGFGLWFGDMLSISLLAGWARHGVPISTATALVALAAVSLVVPWTSKRQIYCHQLCPHGAAQEWLGRFRRWHIHLPSRVSRGLGVVPGALLAGAFLWAIVDRSFDLAALEPFDGWVLKTGATASFSIAIGSLVVSLLIPQAYCRYGCPTGALLKLVRSHGGPERFGGAEWTAAAVLGIAVAWIYLPRNLPEETQRTALQVRRENVTRLEGNAFGTTWSVKIRDPISDKTDLYDQMATELERIESRLSHWRPESETSQFNASETTLEIEYSRELIDLVAFTQKLSSETDGAYDITVAPLVDAWGYGPSGHKTDAPTDEEIRRLLAAVGWRKLHVSKEFLTLQKDVPELRIDLGSVLQGYATDRLSELLTSAGVQEFLIDVGGELRCRGTWNVAIDRPGSSSSTRAFVMRDAALATTGTYRISPDGRPQTRHVISPQTGRPVKSPNVLCAVKGTKGRDVDAWATALFCLPTADALQLAERHGLSVFLIDAQGTANGNSELKP